MWKTLFPSRRRHVGVGIPSDAIRRCCSRVSRATVSSRISATATPRGGSGRTIRFASRAERESVTASTGRQFLTFDHAQPDTQFTAFQHVWRTQDNGGPQAFLEAKCDVPAARQAGVCGDWVPLGVAFPFPAGSDAGFGEPQARRSDQRLLRHRSHRRAHRVRRTHAGRHRHAVGRDEHGPALRLEERRRRGADVEFMRIDTPVTPNRFVTRIVVDRSDPNVAYISYSGFQRAHAATPGHIFRAVYDPDRATRDIHADRLRPRRHPDQHDRVRRRARRSVCGARIRSAGAAQGHRPWEGRRGRIPRSADGRSRDRPDAAISSPRRTGSGSTMSIFLRPRPRRRRTPRALETREHPESNQQSRLHAGTREDGDVLQRRASE